MGLHTPGMLTRELADRLAGSDPLAVLDVRESVERDYCALKLAPETINLHVPMNEVPLRLDEIRAAVGDRTLVVYCHHGIRSRMVADWLTAQGVPNVVNLEGGIDEWSQVVDPGVPRY